MSLKEIVFGLFAGVLLMIGVSNTPNEFEKEKNKDQIENNTTNREGDIEPPKVKIPTNG